MKIHGGMMKGLIDAFMVVYTDSMKGTIDDGMCGAVFRLSVPSVLGPSPAVPQIRFANGRAARGPTGSTQIPAQRQK